MHAIRAVIRFSAGQARQAKHGRPGRHGGSLPQTPASPSIARGENSPPARPEPTIAAPQNGFHWRRCSGRVERDRQWQQQFFRAVVLTVCKDQPLAARLDAACIRRATVAAH